MSQNNFIILRPIEDRQSRADWRIQFKYLFFATLNFICQLMMRLKNGFHSSGLILKVSLIDNFGFWLINSTYPFKSTQRVRHEWMTWMTWPVMNDASSQLISIDVNKDTKMTIDVKKCQFFAWRYHYYMII